MKILAPLDETTDIPTYVSTYHVATFTIPGTLAAGLGQARFYLPQAGAIVSIIVTVNTAPSGSAAVFDVNKNGVTIFTTQANRPSIAASAFLATATADILTFVAGDWWAVDVDTPSGAADALVQIEYRYT